MALFDDTQADALLIGLLERYSPSTCERSAVEFLVERMAGLGFRAYIDGAGNAVGERGDGAQCMLLLGHIDTVSGEIPVRREGNLLYGRGAVDAKGPLAAFVAAAAQVAVPDGWRVVVVGAVEEEAATSKGARFLLNRFAPAGVIIGEPSGWDALTTGYKGRLLVDYALAQDVGHTAGPEISVCEQAVAFWQTVVEETRRFNADKSRIFDQLTPSLRQINSSTDGMREHVEMTIGFRLPPGLDIDRWQGWLLSHAAGAQLAFRGCEVAFQGERNHWLARAFVRALNAEGAQARFKVKSGTSDMNVVGPVWRCPIVAYGPGDSSLDHTPHEHIDLDEYHRAIRVLVRVLTAGVLPVNRSQV